MRLQLRNDYCVSRSQIILSDFNKFTQINNLYQKPEY